MMFIGLGMLMNVPLIETTKMYTMNTSVEPWAWCITGVAVAPFCLKTDIEK